MPIIYSIIAANAGVFLAWNYALPSRFQPESHPKILGFLYKNFTANYQNISEGRWWTLVTHALSHQHLTHFAFNMITLFSYCSLLNQVGIGSRNILLLSVGSAAAGAAGFLLHERLNNPQSRVTAIGASGVVMGMGAAAAFIAPRVKFLIFGIIPMPLWVTVPGFMLMDLYLLDNRSKVAHAGHLGGGLFGGIFAYVFLRRFALWRVPF